MKRNLRSAVISTYKERYIKKQFVAGKTYIPVSGKVFDAQEMLLGVESILDGWWTEGKFALAFEKQFRNYLGVRYVSLVNSGSSANLIALSALTSSVFGSKRLQAGDEIITAATGFPTTINPIIQNRCIPVFVDVDLRTKNATVESIKKAITPKTKAIMMAHTLGNPLPLDGILSLVKEYNLWFVEDCCDALGSTYKGKLVSNFGHVATFSFYPAHQITMGEGGAVVTSNPLVHRAIRQFRDWGRDCWCDTGVDDTCGKRFDWQLGKLPHGYDHKYIYSQIGYNLKLTDMQAALGIAQFKKLPKFIHKRKENFQSLSKQLKSFSWLTFSQAEEDSDPCWFGFAITIASDAPFSKLDLVTFLEKHYIATRSIFAGNITAHPAYASRSDVRIVGTLENSDILMRNSFWIGCYPGITKSMITYITSIFHLFYQKYL